MRLAVHFLVFFLLLACCISQKDPVYYCVDDAVLRIFADRLSCLRHNSITQELMLLRSESAAEYSRVHELMAYEYFVNTPNPFRKSCNDATAEYVPILPMAWKQVANTSAPCDYSTLIKNIIEYVKYRKNTSYKYNNNVTHVEHGQRMLFTVSSTYNLRTAIAAGMQTQVRRGEEYDLVTNFVTSMRIGHYERYPQCPDLLRRSWLYVVEMPYIPFKSFYYHLGQSLYTNKINGVHLPTEANSFLTNKPHQHELLFDVFNYEHRRNKLFLFSGKLQLSPPENICSVRVALGHVRESCISLPRNSGITDILSIYDTTAAADTAVNPYNVDVMRTGVFCLIMKQDSYSTSFLYNALHAGCIPIVISDWYSFATPWLIKYNEFVIRINEEDFLKCPTCVLQHVVDNYFATDISRKALSLMRRSMFEHLPLISYEHLPIKSNIANKIINKFGYSELSRGYLSVPFAALLLELTYSQQPNKDFYFECYAPSTCGASNRPSVPALLIPNLPDHRSHLCQSNARLIGYYKIVYFMQCVRVVWPLSPGKFRPVDDYSVITSEKQDYEANNCSYYFKGVNRNEKGISPTEKEIVERFHRLNNAYLPNNFSYYGSI